MARVGSINQIKILYGLYTPIMHINTHLHLVYINDMDNNWKYGINSMRKWYLE